MGINPNRGRDERATETEMALPRRHWDRVATGRRDGTEEAAVRDRIVLLDQERAAVHHRAAAMPAGRERFDLFMREAELDRAIEFWERVLVFWERIDAPAEPVEYGRRSHPVAPGLVAAARVAAESVEPPPSVLMRPINSPETDR
ncbi:MAG: hypothetical protein J2P19_00285 [Pseudonocardia sp.]|nr:hypothetical protein [Pseudonocardia sp.]